MFKKKYTTEELEDMLLSRYDLELKESKELEEQIFEELRKVQGFTKYLQSTMNQDIVRYFNAQDEGQRNLIRGAFLRSLYMKKKVRSKVDKK